MNRSTSKPRRLRALLALALGAVALLSLAGLAAAKDGGKRSDDSQGRHSHQPTGTIATFDTASGKLTIALTGGDEFSGLVTKRTKIRCEDERSHDSSSRSRARESGRGHDGDDDNGRGANCTAADLVAGAVVDEAELELKRGKAVWDEVELDD